MRRREPYEEATVRERRDNNGVSGTRMSTPMQPKLVPARILVVEDERDIAALVAYHLTKEGYRVRTAGSGSEALTAAGHERPDLIVLDLMLPGFSGLDVLAELKRRRSTSPRMTRTRRRSCFIRAAARARRRAWC
jgi:CheY-like chemotaxis protein